jgi:peptide chain release factor 1
VLPEPTEVEFHLDDRDLEWTTTRGSGAGGQHRNVTDSAVQIKHKPTGLIVRVESERSQHQNRQSALSLLRAKLWEQKQQRVATERARDRKAQVGTGERSDKTWTVAMQRGVVTHHPTQTRFSYERYRKGDYEL